MWDQLYLEADGVKLETTPDRSGTRLRVRVDQVDGVMELLVPDVQRLAGGLLAWLVENGHELPELPAMDDDLEDAGGENPDRNTPAPRPDQAGALVVRREGDRVVIDQADPWVVVSRSLLDAMQRGTIPGATVTRQTFVVEDSDGRRAAYVLEQDAGLGAALCRRVSWRPEKLADVSAVHVVPEHTRSDARWPDCASGFHDRCTSDGCGCPCHARRSVLEQSPER